ncbi:uncharacterized protein [Lolium perenne]|uniref:uncharacterized protein isoform X2 n=1 Tax=Lolium perenne TaxID=4522 RepID=UPI0021F57B5C|nr:cysteine-rich receptor-like protein kinase 27 isoform X2 [Lolium perenne]
MATSSLSCSSSLVLILLLVAVTPVPGASERRLPITTTVTKCYPATNATNSTAFSADVLSLLAALPAAAEPTGFATLRSGHAFARGLCFDYAAPSVCHRCLSLAAKNLNLTSGCGANSHRAGIWSDGCFLSYADNNATTASEDALRPRVISGADPQGGSASYSELQRLASVAQFLAAPAAVNDSMLATVNATAVSWDYAARSTTRVLAQCARDRTAAECDRCLEYSALVAASCCWGLDPWRDGVAAAVLGFNCYLRFEVSTERVPLRQRIATVEAPPARGGVGARPQGSS